MGQEIIKETWTVSRGMNLGIRTIPELRELCEDLDTVADVTKKRWE